MKRHQFGARDRHWVLLGDSLMSHLHMEAVAEQHLETMLLSVVPAGAGPVVEVKEAVSGAW